MNSNSTSPITQVQPPDITSSWIARHCLALFFLAMFSFSYFYQSGEHNENARFAQMRAILWEGTLNINNYLTNTADVIQVGDKFYPNKAPGMLVPTLPVFGALQYLLKFSPLSNGMRDHVLCYLTILGTVGVCSALLSVFLFIFLLYSWGDAYVAIVCTLSYLFGTIAFPYSTLFFSHQLTAAFVFAAFLILYFWSEAHKGKISAESPYRILRFKSGFWLFTAGLILAVAASTEYPCALAAVILGGYAFIITRSLRLLALMALGMFVGSLPLLIYNYLVSGKLFFITYTAYGSMQHASFPIHSQGIGGVRFPSAEVLYKITFGSQRGLFLFNPWLLAFLPGAFFYYRSGRVRETIVALLMIVSFFLFNAGFGDSIIYWGGANSIGPRHIIPMLPFAAYLVAPLVRMRRLKWVIVPLALYSAAVMGMATSVEPRVSMDPEWPLTQFIWPMYLHARFALLFYGTFGHELITTNSVAFNWGKLLNLPKEFQMVPLFLVLAWAIPQLIRSCRIEKTASRPMSFLSGFIVFFALIPAVGVRVLENHPLSGNGLEGTYYRGIRWHTLEERSNPLPTIGGDVEYVKQDSEIDFDWTQGNMPFLGSYSIEWRGRLVVPADGNYRMSISSDDGSILLIDDRVVVDNWGEHSDTEKTEVLNLKAGPHRILIRYYNGYSGAAMHFRWAKDQEARQVVERSYLSYP